MLRSVLLTCSNGTHTHSPLNTTTSKLCWAYTANCRKSDLIAPWTLGMNNTPTNAAMS